MHCFYYRAPEIRLECVALAHDVPPDPLVGWKGGTPPKEPHPLRCLVSSVYPPIFLAINHYEQGRQLAKAGPAFAFK